MNRRDVIVVAVLANVCVVVLMLISALKYTPQPATHELMAQADEPVVEVVEPVKESGTMRQVEEVLTTYQETPQVVAVVKEPVEVGPEPKKVQGPAMLEVLVESGDSLEKLAKRYDMSLEELMRINALTSTRLKIGQKLFVPKDRPMKEAPKAVEGKYYVVKNGDSPWTIAVKNHMRVDELLKLNGLDERSAKKLKPGDRLKIQ